MSTSVAISTMAAAQAAQAQSTAQDALCLVKIKQFDSSNTNTVEMQQYASCVNRMYPQYTAADTIVLKVVIAIFIVVFLGSLIIGLIKCDDWADGIFLSIMSVVGLAVIMFILYGIWYIFS